MADWTGEMVFNLRRLWTEGHSTAQIGLRMGISKNGIVGKAHRLDLPARPSPIKRDPNAPPRVYMPRARAITLPLLASIATSAPVIVEPKQLVAIGKPPKPAPVVDKQPDPAPPVVVPSPYKTCQWITSDRRPWVFCGDATDPRHGTYCTKHARASSGSWRAANLADAA